MDPPIVAIAERCHKLTHINLYGTGITNIALTALANCGAKLEEVYLHPGIVGHDVGKAIVALKEAHKGVAIHFNGCDFFTAKFEDTHTHQTPQSTGITCTSAAYSY